MSKALVILKAIGILLLTGIVGGAIAFLGNQLGRYIGRKKMSIFKLRPRYTSMLITALTGSLIASVTLGLAMLISEPVRITLLTPEAYELKVQDLEDKIAKLRTLQQTDLVYKKQDIILSAVIPARSNKSADQMKEALREVVARANQAAIGKSEMIAKERGEDFIPPPDNKLVGYIPDNFMDVANELSRLNGEYIIFVRAHHHATLGDRFRVELGSPLPNNLVYRQGEVIANRKIDGKADYFAIYDELLKIIKNEVSQEAIVKGVFPNPEDKSVGEFDEKELKALAREIKKINQNVNVIFFTREKTYVHGPLKLGIKIQQ